MCTYWENAVKEFFKKQEQERKKEQLAKANCSGNGIWFEMGCL
ncbi:hypothetical protein AS54_1925 [Bacillus cereus 03BB102]|uniref:Uncharacterized protein n=1 Tax=Bacillus cereus (strain 03BB102) TaxID=572264 RepID=A0A158RTM5_BACC3|nr:hypothetical protein [Bacillus cereus]ACO30791.1 hypothetical protein BCA_1904 [Bacillus cereus 03BB102]AJG52070.1 hypothetical protein AS54_1925 [Bacillus cereus 03BB102]